jgi:hypothetical protein
VLAGLESYEFGTSPRGIEDFFRLHGAARWAALCAVASRIGVEADSAPTANAIQFLSVDHLEHLPALVSVRRLLGDPTPRIVIGEEFGSNMPGHPTEGAAIPLDVEFAWSVSRMCRHTCNSMPAQRQFSETVETLCAVFEAIEQKTPHLLVELHECEDGAGIRMWASRHHLMDRTVEKSD